MVDGSILVTDLRALLEKDFGEVIVSLSWHYPTCMEVLSKITDVCPSHDLIWTLLNTSVGHYCTVTWCLLSTHPRALLWS